MSKELIFLNVADAIVGTIICVFRRITKQTKKQTKHQTPTLIIGSVFIVAVVRLYPRKRLGRKIVLRRAIMYYC